MSNKHTQGPWTLTADPLHFHSLTTVIGGKASYQKNGPPQQMIVQVGGFAEWQEAEANARLIAAAPELLAALETAYIALIGYLPAHRNDVTDAAIGAARAAIAKATGCAA
jgi:hypothetical protein